MKASRRRALRMTLCALLLAAGCSRGAPEQEPQAEPLEPAVESAPAAPPPAGLRLLPLHDAPWLERHYSLQDGWQAVGYEVRVPADGSLHFGLRDRRPFLEGTQAVRRGRARIALGFRPWEGLDSRRHYLDPLLDDQERRRFQETFPDFDARRFYQVSLVLRATDLLQEDLRATDLLQAVPPASTPAPGALCIDRGPAFRDGQREAAPGETLILHTWVWPAVGDYELRVADAAGGMVFLGRDGPDLRLEDFPDPVWQLFVRFDHVTLPSRRER